MALGLECAAQTSHQLRHVVARSRGRRALFPDAAARSMAAKRIAECCERHRLRCIVWCVTDRSLHVVLGGNAGGVTLASEELATGRMRHGHCLSTVVRADLYLLEVARHVLLAPVRSGLVRRAIDWPHSSARESLGLRAAPAWLDASPLLDLLGPRDDGAIARLRRLIEAS